MPSAESASKTKRFPRVPEFWRSELWGETSESGSCGLGNKECSGRDWRVRGDLSVFDILTIGRRHNMFMSQECPYLPFTFQSPWLGLPRFKKIRQVYDMTSVLDGERSEFREMILWRSLYSAELHHDGHLLMLSRSPLFLHLRDIFYQLLVVVVVLFSPRSTPLDCCWIGNKYLPWALPDLCRDNTSATSPPLEISFPRILQSVENEQARSRWLGICGMATLILRATSVYSR